MYMYYEWASLQGEIQCDKANQSVLHKFPSTVGREVATTVVRHIASNLNVAANNSEPSNLNSDRDVKWTMEVICFGLSLPLAEHDTIKECVNVYCEWMSSCTIPRICVPTPVKENPNLYLQDMIHHLLNLFVPRPHAGIDFVHRQAVLCHRVLRCLASVATDSAVLTRDSWEVLLKFLLAANDSLLSPPTDKDDIGDNLCERVLSELFGLWLVACHKCFPSPSLWKTFRSMSINWRHHEALVTQWHRMNHILTSRMIKFMYGPDYPELQLGENETQMIPVGMTDDCIAQCWFRFLHIIQNPVDLCHPEIIGGSAKFVQHVSRSVDSLDPVQHECLQRLPFIFFKAMRGISIMVNAFLGISQSVKAEEDLMNQQQVSSNRHSTSMPPSTPPGQRKSASRPISALASSLTQKASKTSSASTTVPAPKAPPAVPANFYSMLLLESRHSLAPNRPKCNSILHLFGAWLFDAALARVKLHPCHSSSSNRTPRQERSKTPLSDNRQNSLSIDLHMDLASQGDNTYEIGRAEALGTLCRIFCAHKTGETILPVYYTRFYMAMYYGLQTSPDSISGQVLASILFNSCDLLRVDLDGVQLLVPYILEAIQLVLIDSSSKFKFPEQIIDSRSTELRRSCIQMLLSMLCLPLHFKDLQIKEIVPPNSQSHPVTFISLRKKITGLLIEALCVAVDSTNTQMLLGGLMLIVQDLAMCEKAEQGLLQPPYADTSGDSLLHADISYTSTVSSSSTDTSYHEPSYHKMPQSFQDLETAHGLFGKCTAVVCHRLMSSWRTDLNTALAAFEFLGGLAKISVYPPYLLMCKRTVKWIYEFIVYQCSRPATSHSRDLHSMIVAAFRCLTLWLVQHSRIMYDKECLICVLEVVELGISGSKSQRKAGDNQTVTLKDTKTVPVQNRASDPPKYKGDKVLMPASMRVRDAAEGVLTCIIQHVGAFPPPCGPESLFSLLDEKSLLKYASKGSKLPESGSPFRYFVLENSIILGLLEQPLGNVQDPLPTVTAIIRGPFGRHAWTMQMRHSPRTSDGNKKFYLRDPGRPLPMENVGIHHNVKHRYFPEMVDRIPLTKADKSIPTLESLVTDKDRVNLTKLKSFIERQAHFESQVSHKTKMEMARASYPNPETECKPPKIMTDFQTARLFLSHYGFLSLDALKEPSNSSLPPALVMLDTTNTGLFTDLEILDTITARDHDTVHIFYVKAGQKDVQEILSNTGLKANVQPQFLEFLHSLGWPVDVTKHAGWTGHISTSWKITEPHEGHDDFRHGTGGSIYDGRQQVLYWADVSSEIAFVVPSVETFNKVHTPDHSADVSPKLPHSAMDRSRETSLKPKSLSIERTLGPEVADGLKQQRDSPSSPQDAPVLRHQRRQPNLMVGPDTKIYTVWLESFEDNENFPEGELLGVTSTGMEHVHAPSSTSSNKPQDIFIIFIHALKNGLFRIHLRGQVNKISMAIPLVDGMVVSRRCLGTMVRQTAINICRRKRLESETYQPPHVRRKLKIQDMVSKYHFKMNEPEFYTALFQDVPK